MKNLRDIIKESHDDDDTAAHALVLHGDNESHLYPDDHHAEMKHGNYLDK